MRKVQEVWETWLEVTDRLIKACATIALLNLMVQILASFQKEPRIDSILHAVVIATGDQVRAAREAMEQDNE